MCARESRGVSGRDVLTDSYDRIWEANREYVLRALLAITRDVDMAEDCLQDTYLLARKGFPGYRGGSAKAWLVSIARNVFYTCARRKGFSSEESLDVTAELVDDSLRVGSDDYLDLLAVRGAISALDLSLRRAIVMKYYGGCSYDEIGEALSCTPKTAKQRVWRAVQKLRSAICSEEEPALGCSELWNVRALDWLHGALSERESAKIRSHITLCAPCRTSIAEMRRLVAALDKAEGDHRILTLIDLDQEGRTTRYVWVRQINESPGEQRTWRWTRRDGWSIDYLALQGEPVELRWPGVKSQWGFTRFEGDMPSPVPNGGTVDAMFVARPPALSHWEAERQSNGIWHYHHKHTPFPSEQAIFIVTIRLPKGVRLLSAEPGPQRRSSRAGRTSLTWQMMTDNSITSPIDGEWQFEADLQYVQGRGVAGEE
jgi:RNA polymerase sigma factor (sigma-70 family)